MSGFCLCRDRCKNCYLGKYLYKAAVLSSGAKAFCGWSIRGTDSWVGFVSSILWFWRYLLLLSETRWALIHPIHRVVWAGLSPHAPCRALQGFNVNLVTTDRVSALHEACLGGHVACAKVLLENGAQVNAVTIDGITPLFNACCSGSVACVNMLLEFGAKPQLGNHLASPIHEAVKRGHRECMEILLAHEVDIDQEDLQHGTPLYVACTYQRTDCVKKLLELGANVNMGKRLDTPLHAAARKSSMEVVILLTDYGANLKCRNAELKCALDLAVPNSKVEQVLLLREGNDFLSSLF
uniref:Ankyrin repeat and SOCS box containing 11 n=1 Tax=Strix occidentalis caurina TaxID=311401 RepID=A0A8D0KQU5_STROC